MPNNTPHNQRVAFFGGVSSSNPYAPGIGIGGGSRGGRGSGINEWSRDDDFDIILGRARQNPPGDDMRNTESRLEDQHKYAEEDLAKLELDFEERQRLKMRKDVRRRHKYIEDAKKSLDENRPDFIRAYFKPKLQHTMPLEKQLATRHRVDEKAKHPYEDDVPEPIKPTRYHPVLSSKQAQQVVTHGRGPRQYQRDQEDIEKDETNYEVKRLQTPLGLGRTPLLEGGRELDEYLDQANKQNWGDSGPNEPVIEDFQSSAQDAFRQPARPDPIPSMLDEIESEDNPFLPLEAKMDEQRGDRKKPGRLPQDLYNRWDADEGAGGGKEPMGVQDRYPEAYDHYGTVS